MDKDLAPTQVHEEKNQFDRRELLRKSLAAIAFAGTALLTRSASAAAGSVSIDAYNDSWPHGDTPHGDIPGSGCIGHSNVPAVDYPAGHENHGWGFYSDAVQCSSRKSNVAYHVDCV